MKKHRILMLVIISFIINIFTLSSAAEDENVNFTKQNAERLAAENLQKCDIVRNVEERWDYNSPISRRDAFKIAYVFNRQSRNFDIKEGEYSKEELREKVENEMWEWSSAYALEATVNTEGDKIIKYKFDFDDIEDESYDYYFAANLFNCGLVTGQVINNKLYMEFDNNMTYNEALTTICRMLSVSSGTRFNAENYIKRYYNTNYPEIKNPCYQFCVDSGMINSKNILSEYTLSMNENNLDSEITAYEFIYLVNEALYIRSHQIGDYAANYNFRRIDLYTSPHEIDLETQYDIMD